MEFYCLNKVFYDESKPNISAIIVFVIEETGQLIRLGLAQVSLSIYLLDKLCRVFKMKGNSFNWKYTIRHLSIYLYIYLRTETACRAAVSVLSFILYPPLFEYLHCLTIYILLYLNIYIVYLSLSIYLSRSSLSSC